MRVKVAERMLYCTSVHGMELIFLFFFTTGHIGVRHKGRNKFNKDGKLIDMRRPRPGENNAGLFYQNII